MKSIAMFCCCIFATVPVFCQSSQKKMPLADSTKKIQMVEAACGECKFGLKGKSCDLAVRINDVAYFVDGTNIDDHGDAHDKEGFCNAIRKAELQGDIIDNRFKSTYFKLIPTKKKDGLKD